MMEETIMRKDLLSCFNRQKEKKKRTLRAHEEEEIIRQQIPSVRYFENITKEEILKMIDDLERDQDGRYSVREITKFKSDIIFIFDSFIYGLSKVQAYREWRKNEMFRRMLNA